MQNRVAGIFAVAIALTAATGCNAAVEGDDEPEVDAEAYFTRFGADGSGRKAIVPMSFSDDEQEVCFYELSWRQVGTRVSEQRAAQINAKSITVNELGSGPNALAGFTATTGIVGVVVGGVFCVSTGGAGCLILGGSIVGVAVGGGNAAVHAQKWNQAARVDEAVTVHGADFTTLRQEIQRISDRQPSGFRRCPGWQSYATADRSRIWSFVTNVR
jgi:hypothetical protein